MELLGKADRFSDSDGWLLSFNRDCICAVPAVGRNADNLTVGRGNNINFSSRSDLRNFNITHTLSLHFLSIKKNTAQDIHPPSMSSEQERAWLQGSSGTNRTDATASISVEEVQDKRLKLKGLNMVIAEAQKEAEALRQCISDLEASGHPAARLPSSYYGVLPEGHALPEMPMPEPGSRLAELWARTDGRFRALGLRYLEKVLKTKGLLNQETYVMPVCFYTYTNTSS